jgi:hypothetical protein
VTHTLLTTALLALVGCAPAEPKGGDPDDGTTDDTATPDESWACVIDAGTTPDSSPQIGCEDDFKVLASAPLDASIPGARSSKTVVDRVDEDALYFTNSNLYPIHHEFASSQLSGNGLPIVPDLTTFNASQYTAPDRRFLLGAVSHYEGPDAWVYELAPYDTADAEMIALAFRKIRDNAYFGDALHFHPTSEAIVDVAKELPADVPIMTTEELFAGTTYQPLNLGTAMGQLQFRRADEVEDYVNYREIVVLDEIPNDISIVAATITAAFQTPLAHINVLAQNRGTPNMALREAWDNEDLRALEGKWVELVVEAQQWTIREVTQADADAWFEANRPEPLEVSPMDLSVDGVWRCDDMIDPALDLSEAIAQRVPAFGGKATNMAVLRGIEGVPTPNCLGIPVSHYNNHMETHGLWTLYQELTEREGWGDPTQRAEMLDELQDAIKDAPIDPDFLALVVDAVDTDFDRIRMRFRSSTNAEDLGNFTGAGLYDSNSGDWEPDGEDIEDAIKKVWSSVWYARAWEEREYWGINHTDVGMAMLVNPTYQDEQANGVAITGNIFDSTGLEPAFYINAQYGEESVVKPDPGDTTDQILYYYLMPGQPVVYIGRSNLGASDETVLSSAELYELGTALDAIHNHFYEVYGAGGGFYAMDTEFKITVDGHLEIKQARPYPGWSVGVAE